MLASSLLKITRQAINIKLLFYKDDISLCQGCWSQKNGTKPIIVYINYFLKHNFKKPAKIIVGLNEAEAMPWEFINMMEWWNESKYIISYDTFQKY